MNPHSFLACLTFAIIPAGWCAEAKELSDSDRAALLERAQTIQRAFDAGDADAIIRYTHPAILKFFPSREQFEATTREAIKMMEGKVVVEKNEWGVPTAVYPSGMDEVAFVPKTTVVRIGDKRARGVGFLIAARQQGSGDWFFLDSASLRKDPSLLWKLFPDLPKDVKTPENTMELLK
ncbi:MAG TPA: hypothetical protein VFG14_02550 [Chthoniobacteraceae bacterium]|nr:hypothetical protein [Chthoniobacteraceae bacterium]